MEFKDEVSGYDTSDRLWGQGIGVFLMKRGQKAPELGAFMGAFFEAF